MAENPACWGRAIEVISDTINDFHRKLAEDPSTCGYTLAAAIAVQLEKEGLLRLEHVWQEPTLPPTYET